MSLLMPVNISSHEDAPAIISNILSVTTQPCYSVFEGQQLCKTIPQSDFQNTGQILAQHSIIYILKGTRGNKGPIAIFLANQSLKNAKLQYWSYPKKLDTVIL